MEGGKYNCFFFLGEENKHYSENHLCVKIGLKGTIAAAAAVGVEFGGDELWSSHLI